MNRLIPLFLAAIVLFGVVLYWFDGGSKVSWEEGYKVDENRPYDLSLFYNMMKSNYEFTLAKDRVKTSLSDDPAVVKNQLYVFGGKKALYSEDEAWQLRRFAEKGGTVLLLSKNIPDSLKQFLFFAEDCGTPTNRVERLEYANTVSAHFEHPSLRKSHYNFAYFDNGFVSSRRWSYLSDELLCDSKFRYFPLTKLGYFDLPKMIKPTGGGGNPTAKWVSYCNFFKLNVGKGAVYVHLNPIMLSNVNMVDSIGVEYAMNVLAHFGRKKVVWDIASVKPLTEKANKRQRPDAPAQSPFEYIFSQRSLRLSWYLFLGLSVLYVLFGARRRQRIVPVIATNRNTSLEFIETISRLYFQKQDHKGIAQKQMELFLAHIRQRYNLVTNNLDSALVKRISIRAKVDEAVIQAIFTEYERIKPVLNSSARQLSVAELNQFYQLIERFHNATD